MSFKEENSNSLIKDMELFVKEEIISAISSIYDISISLSLFNQDNFTTYICKKCKRYPNITFLCEEKIEIKCCEVKNISIKEYLSTLTYFEEDIKCKEGGKFVCYCLDCKKDICNECKLNEHKKHNIKDYEVINKDDNIQELKEDIGKEIGNQLVEKINSYYIKKTQEECIKQNEKIEENMRFDYLDFYEDYCGEIEIPPYISLISIILGIVKKCEPNYSHFSNIKNIHLFLKTRKKK